MAVALAVVGLSSCGGSSPADTTPTLGASEHEFAIDLSRTEMPAGRLLVRVANEGKATHELVAFRTDLGEGALPLIADGSKVDERNAGVTHIDPEAENVQPGQNKTVMFNLAAGRYVLVCNLPGHYTSGMHATLNVT